MDASVHFVGVLSGGEGVKWDVGKSEGVWEEDGTVREGRDDRCKEVLVMAAVHVIRSKAHLLGE